jgi:hypothetical protein
MQTVIKNEQNSIKNPNKAVKNGHNWRVNMLRLSGIEPSTPALGFEGLSEPAIDYIMYLKMFLTIIS